MTLAELKAGEMAEIVGYTMGNAAYRAKLLALGLTHGTQLKIVNVAPLPSLPLHFSRMSI